MRKWTGGLELAGGILLCALAAATPWLFGTTEPWSVRLMNAGSYAAALVMLAAAAIRRFTRVDDPPASNPAGRAIRSAFLLVNLLLLAFCLVAYFNARATFAPASQSFDYRSYIQWLPTTYDARLTLDLFFTLLACFSAFWAGRYWLMRGWERALEARGQSALATALSNRRLQAFLWVLTLNGLLIAVQGILQRLSGSPKLLWLRLSYYAEAASCFGPFAYRGNAAEFLNLIWPLALGFWWVLSRDRRRRQGSGRIFTDGPEMLLIPAVVIMIAATVVCASRGGVAVAGGLFVLIVIVLGFQSGVTARMRVGGLALLLAVAGTLALTGWDDLSARFKEDQSLGPLSGRLEIYGNARQIAVDFPVFGTGPGSFRSVYHLYRDNAQQVWHGYLHDDWLETRVTFGWVGFSLVLLQLLLLAAWIPAKEKAPIPAVFPICATLGLAGCLIHAKFDFPFQTYSILYTFVVIAAILTTVTPERR